MDGQPMNEMSAPTPEERQQWREDAEDFSRVLQAYANRTLALLEALNAAEAEVMNLSHDYDRRGERLWRLAAKAGWTPHEADNDATAELWIADALAALDGGADR